METKGERRERKYRKARSHKVSGASVRLLQRIILEKSVKADGKVSK